MVKLTMPKLKKRPQEEVSAFLKDLIKVYKKHHMKLGFYHTGEGTWYEDEGFQVLTVQEGEEEYNGIRYAMNCTHRHF